MTDRARAEEAFQRMLEGAAAPSEQLAPLARIAVALRPSGNGGARPEFKAALRSTLVKTASAAQEAHAEVFAAALSAPARSLPAEVRTLVAVASALQPATLAGPSPSFRFQLRNQLVDRASRGTQVARARGAFARANVRFRRSFRVVAGTGLAATLLLGTGSAFAAAQHSLPGDTLYGVKRFHESASLWVSSGPSKGFKLLGFARTRTQEVRGLTQRGDRDQTLYVKTFADMNSETVEGTTLILNRVKADPTALALLDRVNSFSVLQVRDLSSLLPSLPAGARPAAQDSLDLIRNVGSQVTHALNGCSPCEASTPGLTGTAARPANTSTGNGAVACACTQTPRSNPGSGGSSNGGSTDPGSGTPSDNGNGDSGTPNPPPPDGPIPTTIPGGSTLDDLLNQIQQTPPPITVPENTPSTLPLPTTLPSTLPSVIPTTLSTGVASVLPSTATSVVPKVVPTTVKLAPATVSSL